MSLKALTDDEKGELKEQFCVLDKEESGFIQLNELKDALDLAGFKVPGWRVRDMIDKIDRETTNCPGAIVGQRKLSYGEFEHVSSPPVVPVLTVTLYCSDHVPSCHGVSPDHFQLCCELKSKEVSQSFKQAVTKKDNIKTHGGMSQASADGESTNKDRDSSILPQLSHIFIAWFVPLNSLLLVFSQLSLNSQLPAELNICTQSSVLTVLRCNYL